MKYAKYIDIPNWKQLQQDIIAFKKIRGVKGMLWWPYLEDEIKESIPNLYDTFISMGLTMRQMILFDNLPNDRRVTDPNDPNSMFIHVDAADEEGSVGTEYPSEIEYSTNFDPTCALNIPLENCEGSETIWYRVKDKNKPNVYYPHYDCGGLDPVNCEEIFSFELNRPSVIRINVPHTVYNPHKQIRSVATFRFYQSLENFLV